MTVHDFDDSLATSHAYADEPWWPEIYGQAFPGYTMQDMRADGWWQRAGIDRILHLPNGTQVTVDEKVRQTARGDDFALEAFSKWRGAGHKGNVPGWIDKPLACDYIAYAFVRPRRCYLLPTRELQRAWQGHRRDWWALAADDRRRAEDGERHGPYRFVEAQNRGYVTLSVAVPVAVVLDGIRDSLIVEWSTPPLSGDR